MKIFKNGGGAWSNLHNTFTVQVKDVYDLANEDTGSPIDNYNDTTKGIQQLIQQSIAANIPMKALGGAWSLSPIAATSGIILNTKLLNTIFTVSDTSVMPAKKDKAKGLFLAQCGTGIWELNDYLHKRGRSLPACGASNGQTIAGAIATGTHGAAIGFGGTQEAVTGMHIITGPTSQIFLERASDATVTDAFAAKLGAKLVRDDEAFNAALVSFGSFGFIAGVMIQTEEDYILECYLRRVPYDAAFLHQVTTLDFKHPMLPFPNEKPFHFQSLINPYDIDKGVYMTTMYKRPYRSDYTPPAPNGAGIGPGDDAPCFIGKVAGALPAVVPLVVNKVLAASLTPYEAHCGRLGEIFNNTTLRGKVASAAIGMPINVVDQVINVLLAVNKTAGPFAGLFAFRFVKGSKAMMAFTKFDPTCVLELDGVLSPETKKFYDAVWNELEKRNIPFTFHWGKMNSLTPARMKRMYGTNLDRFLAARKRIVAPDTLRIFSNDTSRQWGIDTDTLKPGGNTPPSAII